MSRRWIGLLLFGFWIGRGGVAHAAFNESPDPVAFGNVGVTQSSTMSTTLGATGGTNVTVTVALDAAGDCSQFQLVAPTTPATSTSPVSPGCSPRRARLRDRIRRWSSW